MQLSDGRLGIRTARKESIDRLRLPPALRRHAHCYEPSPYGEVTDALLSTTVDPTASTLWDIGCGKGRVLIEGLIVGFSQVVGVEASSVMATIAHHHIQHFGVSSPRQMARVVQGDALGVPIPEGPLVVYLFNPFDFQSTKAFATRLQRHAEDSRHPLWVVYYMPEHRRAWAHAPYLTAVEDTPRRLILRRRTHHR
ncbi:MAG: class I SAM-dependent methyltransferase [Myxococcota bacterium]